MFNNTKKNRLIIFLLALTFFCSMSIFAQDKDKKKEEEEPAPPKGVIVAMLPFESSYDAGEDKAAIFFNEVVVNMLSSGVFVPASMKQWSDEQFVDGKGLNIHYIMDRVKTYNLQTLDGVAAEYICHGTVFKVGNEYGVKLSLFPLSPAQMPTYYYRTFNKFETSIKVVTEQMMAEMIERGTKKEKPLFNKGIVVENFDIDFSIYSESKSGEITKSDLPFVALKKVELKKNDTFYHDLLLYNFHLTRAFTVWDNNLPPYTKKTNNFTGAKGVDYIVKGKIDISDASNNRNTLTLTVTDNSRRVIYFQRTYHFKAFDHESLYEDMRRYTKDIITTLLNSEEKKLMGEVSIDSYYGRNEIFSDGYYLGKGNQENLLLPVEANKARIWIGSNELLKYVPDEVKEKMTGKDELYKEFHLNISPMNKNKVKQPFFKYSLGGSVLIGGYLLPQVNAKSEVYMNEENLQLKFYLGDFMNSHSVKNNLIDLPGFQAGAGLDFTMMSKYFSFTTLGAFRFGYMHNEVALESNKFPIELSVYEISNFNVNYIANKFSFVGDISILPAVNFFKSDSPIRMYAGIGFYTSIWVNYLSEKMNGTAVVRNVATGGAAGTYKIDTQIKNKTSVFAVFGLFPELGFTVNFSKFNYKTGLAYYFDLYDYQIFTSKDDFSSYDLSNVGTLMLKISFGQYLN